MKPSTIGAAAAAVVASVFALLLLAHDPLVFWNDDYELSILPVCADIARAWGNGEFPLLSPYSWVCGNLAGEFQYGVFSVFINALVVLIWKFPLLFSQQAAALSTAHLAVAAGGGFLLARSRNISTGYATFVGLVTALNGWIICWGSTDWFGALGAFAWLPWAWWAAERALDTRRCGWRFLWPVPFIYLLVTGGFPYTVLMLVIVFGWLAIRAVSREGKITAMLPLLWGGAIGLGLAAPAWLALLDYIQGSARQVQDPAGHLQWLVPPSAWPALILPCWTVNWANFASRMVPHTSAELACGLVPPAALIAGLAASWRQIWNKLSWELALFFCIAALSMMPTAGVFRWSFRWLPLFHLVFALIAAEILQLLERNWELRRLLRPGVVGLLLVIVTAAAMYLTGSSGKHDLPYIWLVVGIALAWAAIELSSFRSGRVYQWLPAIAAFGVLLVTYLCIPPNCGVPKYNFAPALRQTTPLDPQRLYLSVYPPPETAYRIEAVNGPVGQTVRPGSSSMWAGLRFINGYSPIRPAGVAREFATAIHGEVDANMADWLVTREAGEDGLLARIGVDGIIVARSFNFSPTPQSEWELNATTDEGRIFHRRGGPLPVVRAVNFDGKHGRASVSEIVDSRNCVSAFIDVPAGGSPALLAFSRPYFPGFRVMSEGAQIQVASYRGLIPTVEAPAGIHARVTLIYRPRWLVAGSAIAMVSGVAWIGSLVLAFRRRWRP